MRHTINTRALLEAIQVAGMQNIVNSLFPHVRSLAVTTRFHSTKTGRPDDTAGQIYYRGSTGSNDTHSSRACSVANNAWKVIPTDRNIDVPHFGQWMSIPSNFEVAAGFAYEPGASAEESVSIGVGLSGGGIHAEFFSKLIAANIALLTLPGTALTKLSFTYKGTYQGKGKSIPECDKDEFFYIQDGMLRHYFPEGKKVGPESGNTIMVDPNHSLVQHLVGPDYFSDGYVHPKTPAKRITGDFAFLEPDPNSYRPGYDSVFPYTALVSSEEQNDFDQIVRSANIPVITSDFSTSKEQSLVFS